MGAPEAGWSSFTTAGAATVTDSHQHGRLWRAIFYVSYLLRANNCIKVSIYKLFIKLYI